MDKANDLQQRVELIERLVQEGRHGCEAYGWIFFVWGLGYFASLTWDCYLPFTQANLPWSIFMPLCGVIMGVIGWRRRQMRRVKSTVGRAVGLGWMAATVPLCVCVFLENLATPPHGAAGLAHGFVSLCLILGIPNMASGLILRWRIQIAVAILWWLGAVAFVFIQTMPQLVAVAFALTVLCWIAFGLYLMVMEARTRQAAPHG